MVQPPNPAPKRAFVLFLADVNEASCANLVGTTINLRDQGATEICLLLATTGGKVISGFAAHHTLRGLGVKLVTHNVGSINSIGNVLFLAGDERFACPHSTFMFHGVLWGVPAGNMTGQQTREILASITADEERISALIAERTNLTTEQVEAFFRDAATKDAEYALGVGIIDAVAPVDIPPGATLNWIT
jgi:ATP-dependent protease ClpP protease subunit